MSNTILLELDIISKREFNNIIGNSTIEGIDDDLAFYVADLLPDDSFKLDSLCQYYKDEKTTNSKRLVKSIKNCIYYIINLLKSMLLYTLLYIKNIYIIFVNFFNYLF